VKILKMRSIGVLRNCLGDLIRLSSKVEVGYSVSLTTHFIHIHMVCFINAVRFDRFPTSRTT
jgi:hypothetical protein